jgi:ERCC4-related helicase
MTFSYHLDERINLSGAGRIPSADAQRQQMSAQEILNRLKELPGIILADEVGMGKTFVALAVAASVALQDTQRRPVVVMVPPNLKEKWPQDFGVFRKLCVDGDLLRAESAEGPVAFLRLVNDHPSRRPHIIFLTHGAMHRNLSDGWVRLAIMYRALNGRHDAQDIRRALARYLGRILRMNWIGEDVWTDLLNTNPRQWLKVLNKHGIDPENDNDSSNDKDPIPESLLSVIWNEPSDDVFNALKDIPRRASSQLNARLKDARKAINDACRRIWKVCLKKHKLDLPLLILDEAHHLKNASTRVSSLFKAEESEQGEDISRGELAGCFSRMLFMTATPFQLGHHELCSILERFEGIQWSSPSAPSLDQPEFKTRLSTLLSTLNNAQFHALKLDEYWGKLNPSDLVISGEPFKDVDAWWEQVSQGTPDTETGRMVKAAYEQAKKYLKEAEAQLKPWIIRHLRARKLEVNGRMIDRRQRHQGQNVIPGVRHLNPTGLRISDGSVLPFLLASRAVAVSPETRPVFAEGLSSSYEAFLNTKRMRERNESLVDTDSESQGSGETSEEIQWYVDQIEKSVPIGSLEDSLSHPKVRATVDRTIDLWKRGEKVVVFCHYIATGKTLRRCISHAIRDWIDNEAAKALNCPKDEVDSRLGAIGDQFFQGEGVLRKTLDLEILNILSNYPLLKDLEQDILRVVRRNLRTPSFLVRYFDLTSKFTASTIHDALNRQDESGLSLRNLIIGFFEFLQNNCETKEKRENFIKSCLKITPRTMKAADTALSYGPDEEKDDRSDRIMPNVRLANGSTTQETRQTLMRAFNTPFYPEILVASAIMAEGVDLHLNCRHVIHHDLCWNPSTLEQRTGRVDRLGSKMERCGQSIQVYLPYIAETQDEKMFRVVLDREKWFNVVMGEKIATSFAATEKLAERIPLPDRIVEDLIFDFSVRPSPQDNIGNKPA